MGRIVEVPNSDEAYWDDTDYSVTPENKTESVDNEKGMLAEIEMLENDNLENEIFKSKPENAYWKYGTEMNIRANERKIEDLKKKIAIYREAKQEFFAKLKEYYTANDDVKIKNVLNNISNDLNIGDLSKNGG